MFSAMRPVQELGVLGHVADVAAQGRQRHVPDVLAVDQDATLLHVHETQQQFRQRRLARTRGPDQRHVLARAGR